jgi:FlaA1/EpsC-like NDP-sugar epimerase
MVLLFLSSANKIEQRKPVTVTHPDVTRYFMTIPEACQLVLEAGAMGNGGEIFIFDMGAPVRIIDLAEKMIKLAGLKVGKDIEIVFTGLRPGEKLTEELLDRAEDTIPTHHPKIKKASVRTYDFNEIYPTVEQLVELAQARYPNMEIVKVMKEIVPEFTSQNSTFSRLDVKS